MRNSRNGNGRSGRSSRQSPDQNQYNEYRHSRSQSGYRDEQGNSDFHRDDREDFDTRNQERYSDQDFERGNLNRGGQNQSFGSNCDRGMRNDFGHNSYTENEGYDQGNYRGAADQYSQGGNQFSQSGPDQGGYDQEYSQGSDWRRQQGAGAGRTGQESWRGANYGGSRGSRIEDFGGMSGGFGRNSGSGDSNRRGTSSFDTNQGGQWGSSVESMRGKGPKGYRRSDERVEEQVNDVLTDDHMLDASSVEVTVKNGEVTLSGTVTNREAKRRAEDLAEGISGVNNVENRIRVSAEKSEDRGTQDRGAQESDKSKSQNKTKTHQNAEA